MKVANSEILPVLNARTTHTTIATNANPSASSFKKISPINISHINIPESTNTAASDVMVKTLLYIGTEGLEI